MNIVLGDNFEYNDRVELYLKSIMRCEYELTNPDNDSYKRFKYFQELEENTKSLLKIISDQNKKAKQERIQIEQEKMGMHIISDVRNAVLSLLDNLLEKNKIDLKEYKINFSKVVNTDDLDVISSVSRELTTKYINI